MAAQAREQASRAQTIALNMEHLTAHLNAATQQLRRSSEEVEAALDTVARIAQQTRMLAINASIEAARAGEHGRPFGVVVEEVQRLADRTGDTTETIEERMQDMRASITRVSSMTAEQDGAGGELPTVARASAAMDAMAASAGQQLASADSLNALGSDVRGVAESLLLAVGTFRFHAHTQAERETLELIQELVAVGLSRRPIERAMERWIERHPHFELVYVTDPAGTQITDNIACAERRARHDAGFGRDWSSRPWYRAAVASDTLCSSDLYRSSATGDFCFTISAALRDGAGVTQAVVAADVNFQQLIT